MQSYKKDCFDINMKFWKFLGIAVNSTDKYYKYYTGPFIFVCVILYNLLITISFYFLPRQLDIFIEDLIFYFVDLAVASKVLTFVVMRSRIATILINLENDVFQPTSKNSLKVMHQANNFIKRYWKIVAVVSLTSHLTHVLSPLLSHFTLQVKLELPVCKYSFLSKENRERFIYPLYFYQSIGMSFHMLYNLNIDTFFLGLMILIIAQLDMLDEKLRKVTKVIPATIDTTVSAPIAEPVNDSAMVFELNKCIIHYDEVSKLCSLVEYVFSVTLFIQFSMASCIICVCLFRFTMPAPSQYYVFLATYMFVMIIQIMVPCWFGTEIMVKSNLLSLSVYDCDWTDKSRRFKTNLRIFVERANKPLSITGGKMFSLSLATFTSIMNSAYSFFTLLRHMQTRQA